MIIRAIPVIPSILNLLVLTAPPSFAHFAPRTYNTHLLPLYPIHPSPHAPIHTPGPSSTSPIDLIKPLTGNPVHCYYCPNCTSHVYHHQTVMGDKIVIRTALLDGGKGFKVAAEIFGKDRLGWQPELAKTFPGPPQ